MKKVITLTINPLFFTAIFQGAGGSGTSVVREPPTHVYSLPSTSERTESPSVPWNMQTTPQKSVSPISMLSSARLVDMQSDLMQGQVQHQTYSDVLKLIRMEMFLCLLMSEIYLSSGHCQLLLRVF